MNPVVEFLKHSERLQELCLILPPEFIPAKLSFRAPRLENLEIHLYGTPEPSLAITDGDTPVLRRLKVVHCPLPWHSLNLRRLNTLHIFRTRVQLNMAEFLALLSGMQELSFLRVEHSLSSAGLSAVPKINLPPWR